MKSYPQDYLKYWRVVRFYIRAKYGLTVSEIEMLLFLYSERYFGKEKFEEFDKLMSWRVTRFAELLSNGWIVVFRPRQGNKKTLYELSFKSRRLVESIYKILNGEEISTSGLDNPIFARDVKYTDKVYRDAIIRMNAYAREKRLEK